MQSMRFPLLLLSLALVASADEAYQKPPQPILDVLNAPDTPRASISPAYTHVLFAEPLRYPPIADVAAPMLRLAGVRINPRNNGPHRAQLFTNLVLKRVDDGAETRIALPAGAKITLPKWSPDGKQFTFVNDTPAALELWIGSVASGRAHKQEGVQLNAALGFGGFNRSDDVLQWVDNQRLLVTAVPAGRGAPPVEPAIPIGPHTQESLGRTGPIRTYEDMLAGARDEALFDYYATAQLMLVDTATGHAQAYGTPGIFAQIAPAPDGRHVLVARVHRPYSYLHPYSDFPKDVEIWDGGGKIALKVASLGLADRVPIGGVPTGPRDYAWRPTEPATVLWVEAMDGGNPKEKVPHRDRILMAQAPFNTEPKEVWKVEQRLRGMLFGENNGTVFVEDFERDSRRGRMFYLTSGQEPKVLWSLNVQDAYHNPGRPVMKTLPNGYRVVREDAGSILLSGSGATPQGDRPFLDRMDLGTAKTDRIFRSGQDKLERIESVLDEHGTKILTLRESQTEPPNYFIRATGANPAERAFTHYADPTPGLRGITKQLVTYQRPDGVQLSFTLYLPPNYKAGTKLPTVVWAYPLEYNDADTAGQVTGSPNAFTRIAGPSELFFLLEGYAVLDNAAMPVIGDPETVNNTYLDQIVMDAKAAIDKAVEMGVTDPDRVGVGGHSYGAFMTANLLAHSNLFRAGIARSGAYNRTLTAFGFQNERRTLWEAPEVYLRMSPFLNANKIKAPILLIHGEADDNTGTFPIQSERMYQAIRGNGGIIRYVTLPAEAHGYAAKETIEHVIYEEISWFNKYVKNAEPTSAGNE
jgi:dipeptidyl aminopeptidase/acylaminoacyl peptidase